jgi:hypothetical protein
LEEYVQYFVDSDCAEVLFPPSSTITCHLSMI